MGESSLKSMRGGGMEDVIFAGTSSRPPRDFAEVAIHCDTEGAIVAGLSDATEGHELEVIRRIERGAGSAYRANGRDVRSEEHTSELQSLMRISYAVFCLKKKTKNKQLRNEEHAH